MKTLKNLLLSTFLLSAFFTFGQQITIKEWNKEASTDIRLLPKYGNKEKTKKQKEADKIFIDKVLELDQFKNNRTDASNEYIQLGFSYLYKNDLKTAMYRFNQAYLLNHSNTDIYLGYAELYMTLGDFESASEQYLEGLSIKPANPRLLTDYASLFIEKHNKAQINKQKEEALTYLGTAIKLLTEAYQHDNKSQNTLIKLSVSHYLKEDCGNALRYYKEHQILAGNQLTEEYAKALEVKCEIK